MPTKLSIIIPVYNAVETIEAAILSVLDQHLESVELILIDGVSRDSTLERVRPLQHRLAHVVSEPDKGVYDAINKGVALATGDWVYVLGADDVMLPNLAVCLALLEKADTIYYGDVILSSSGLRYGGKFNCFTLLKRNIPHQAMFYPRALFQTRQYDLRYRILADYAFNLSCFCDPGIRFKYVDRAIAKYNDISGLSSTTRDVEFSRDKQSIVRASYPLAIYLIYSLYRRLAAKTGG